MASSAQSYYSVRLLGAPHISGEVLPSADVWVPATAEPLRGVFFLFGGDGGADSSFQQRATNPTLQAWAQANGFALAGADDNSTLGGTLSVSSDPDGRERLRQHIDAAMAQIAITTGRSELAAAPVLVAGYSRGAFEASHWAAVYPQRVLAFSSQRGLASMPTSGAFAAAAAAPGLVLPGSRDNNGATSPFVLQGYANDWIRDNRPLTVATAWGEDHFGQFGAHSLELMLAFFESVMRLRMPEMPGDPLLDLTLSAGGWRGTRDEFAAGSGGQAQVDNSEFRQIAAMANYVPEGNLSPSWLPDAAFAHAYRAFTSADAAGRSLNTPRTGYPKQSAAAISIDSTLEGLVFLSDGETLNASVDPREFTGMHRAVWHLNGVEIARTTDAASQWALVLENLSTGFHVLSLTSENADASERFAAFRLIQVQQDTRWLSTVEGGSLTETANWSGGENPFGVAGGRVTISGLPNSSLGGYDPAIFTGDGTPLTLGSLLIGTPDASSDRWLIFDASAPLHFDNGTSVASIEAIIPTGWTSGGEHRRVRFGGAITADSPLEIAPVGSPQSGRVTFDASIDTGANPLRVVPTNRSPRNNTFASVVEFLGPVTTSELIIGTTINSGQFQENVSFNRNHRTRVRLETANPGLTGIIALDQSGRGHSWQNNIVPTEAYLDLNHADALGTAKLVTRDDPAKLSPPAGIRQIAEVSQLATAADLTLTNGLEHHSAADLILRGRPMAEGSAHIRVDGVVESSRRVYTNPINSQLIAEPGALILASNATSGTQRVVWNAPGELPGGLIFGENEKPDLTTEVQFFQAGLLALQAPGSGSGPVALSITGGGEVRLDASPAFENLSSLVPLAETLAPLQADWSVLDGTLTVNNGRTVGHGSGTGAISLAGANARLAGSGIVGKGSGQSITLAAGAKLRAGDGAGQGDLAFHPGASGTVDLGLAPVLEIALPSKFELMSGMMTLPPGGLDTSHFALSTPGNLTPGTYPLIAAVGGTLQGSLGSARTLQLGSTEVTLRLSHGGLVADLAPAGFTPVYNFAVGAPTVSGNGRLEPGLTRTLTFTVTNNGNTFTEVSATLSADSGEVTIANPALIFQSIAPGATVVVEMEILIAPAALPNSGVTFTLALEHLGGITPVAFARTIQPPLPEYAIAYTHPGHSITQGGVDEGTYFNDGVTEHTLPFAVKFFDTVYPAGSPVGIDSNGTFRFGALTPSIADPTPLPNDQLQAFIAPFWKDLRTDRFGTGLFTLVSGSAPHRVWQIEWRTVEYAGEARRQFAMRLYENSTRIDLIYGAMQDSADNPEVSVGAGVSIGLQQTSEGPYFQYSFDEDSVYEGLLVILTYDETITPPNLAPVIGRPSGLTAEGIHLPEGTHGVLLETTVTDDGLPTGALTVEWSQISGPAGVVFAPPDAATTAATFPGNGEYRLRLTASDGALQSTWDLPVRVGGAPGYVTPRDGLILHYPFDEGAGSAIGDRSRLGNDHSTTVAGATWTPNGRFGGAYGTDTLTALTGILPANQSDLRFNPRADAHSVSVWVRTETTNNFRYPWNRGTEGSLWTTVNTTDGLGKRLQVHSGGDNAVYDGSADGFRINDGQWHLLTFVNFLPNVSVARWTTRLYLNDGSDYLEFRSGSSFDETNALAIGMRNDGANRWIGLMDDFRIYDRALSAAEIAELYNPATQNSAPAVSILPATGAVVGASIQLAATVIDDGLPEDPGTVSVAWSLVAGPGAASFSDVTTINPGVSFDTPGDYTLRLTAADGSVKSFADLMVSVTPAPPATGYAGWSAGIAWPDPSRSDPLASATGDGIANLMKYALGLDPLIPGMQGALSHAVATREGSEVLSLTFTRPHPAPNDLAYTIEASSTLAPDSWAPVPNIVESIDGSTATITAYDSVPIQSDHPRRFLRLRVDADSDP